MYGSANTVKSVEMLEIIAFCLDDLEFCFRTTAIREIRGWGPATPIPHVPAAISGVMNLRGTVIPIIDLARKLGMKSNKPNERSAIVVAEVHGVAFGLVVDRVSDILTVRVDQIQPVPTLSVSDSDEYAEGIIVSPQGMICFLNLERMFRNTDVNAVSMLVN
ncbi:chemotaxis protein CheW [Agrobacterium tumefaciens]|uniref:Chemotaxis protein CheW n=1 Tax=Agrobacterium tumefaciens TaxID=358 RepID=A0A0D0J211_AGRTU|nr:chemotaxis protein CheW [Agrobacterium tumefaciens]